MAGNRQRNTLFLLCSATRETSGKGEGAWRKIDLSSCEGLLTLFQLGPQSGLLYLQVAALLLMFAAFLLVFAALRLGSG